jgi:Ca2+-binding RTX toxin-like protein
MAVFFGTDDADNLFGTLVADTIYGAAGNDILSGLNGNDTIYGEAGNDSLFGGLDQDVLYGGEGNDTFNATGGFGQDFLYGGMGDDLYVISVGDSLTQLFEDPNQGIDTVRSSLGYTLNDNVENLALTGAAIEGNGNGLKNQITGNNSNNILRGWSDNDNIDGRAGDDNIDGGGGNDILNGGAGIDKFIFNMTLSGVDTINDFLVGTDKIVLNRFFFSALETFAGSPLVDGDFAVISTIPAAEQFVAATSSKEIVYNRVTGNLFYNPNNATAGFGVGGGRFATIVGSPDNFSNQDILTF